ncbi:MAG: hypothetical protein A2Y10_05695 [Planctomycetes bacterium GWF2_41_51]|nr:MAG: hypothetical protein A2Y10_05695 [Planctomycetes bacterium GWF2_41_51]
MHKVAFIGTGGRASAWARHYAASDKIEVAALADPDKRNRKVMAQISGIKSGFEEYDDYRDMLKSRTDLDGIVICTPNHLHAEQAVACLELGLPIALEKPLATTKADCERIINAEAANNGRTLLGFVLRSTPLYSRIHELISTDRIGRVTSIQADELPGLGVTSIMNRGFWRRYCRTSGGAMLEKCCHDMDVLTWLIGSRPSSLNSYGSRLIFGPNPSLPQHCDDCKVSENCKYYKEPVFSGHEDADEKILHKFVREDNACIYNIDKDIVDTQSVGIEYENGAIVNFMLNFNCYGQRTSRNFYAIGTKGRIWANLHEQKVYLHENNTDQETSFDCTGDGSGHGGGDRIHAMQLQRMMADPDFRPESNATAGYLSAVMCFASDVSRIEGRRVYFRYEAKNRIDII